MLMKRPGSWASYSEVPTVPPLREVVPDPVISRLMH